MRRSAPPSTALHAADLAVALDVLAGVHVPVRTDAV
jgi:hypothetical protein